MARFLFLLLVVANVAFAGHIYLNAAKPSEALPSEVNPQAMKVVSITDSAKAQRDALEAKKLVESLTGAACLQFAVKPADAARAQTLLGGLLTPERLSSRNVEEFTRFAVALPVQRDRKSADTLLANLKKANVKDVLILADNSVSLGLFSTEEAAKRVVAELDTKAAVLVKGVVITPKNPVTKETAFTVREPDPTLVAKIALMQRDFAGSQLKGLECPVAPATAAVAATTNAPATAAVAATTNAPATAQTGAGATNPPATTTPPAPSPAPAAGSNVAAKPAT